MSVSLFFLSFLCFSTTLLFLFFFLLIPPPPISTLFPYTTLFRSIPIPPVMSAALCLIVGAFLVFGAWCLMFGSKHQTPSSKRSEEHTSELQSPYDLVCRLLLEKKNKT